MARLSLLIGVAALLMFESARGAPPQTDRATREAYAWTIKCFVANGNAYAERREAGDIAAVAAYDKKAKNAFDGTLKLGRMMGLTNRQMNYDLDIGQDIELRKMVQDGVYYRQIVANCKGLGLM